MSRLLADTNAVGSMNTVSPVRDVSWTIPSPSDFAEALSGNTNRSARTVKNWSCNTETYSSDRITFSIAPRALSASPLRSSRNRASSGDAASLISPEASNVAPIVRANPRGGSSFAASAAISGVAARVSPTPAVPTNARRAPSAMSVSTATGRSSSAPSTIPFSAEASAASISGAASDGSGSPARSNAANSATAAIRRAAPPASAANSRRAQSLWPAADCASDARRLSSSLQSRTSGKRDSVIVRPNITLCGYAMPAVTRI